MKWTGLHELALGIGIVLITAIVAIIVSARSIESKMSDCESNGGQPVLIDGRVVCFAKGSVLK